MQRVTVHVTAATVLASIALLFGSATALADANPNNRGHHYGQLKHQHQPPPPAPAPAPATQPTHVAASAVTAAVHLGTVAAAPDQTTKPAALPEPAIPLPNPAPVHLAAANPSDGVSWLVLLILPLLATVWVLVFARGAHALARSRRTAAPA